MAVTIKPKISTMHTRFSKTLAKSDVSGPYDDYSSTYQKNLKICQYLDINDMTSPSKFGHVTQDHRSRLNFMGRLYFTDQLFSEF